MLFFYFLGCVVAIVSTLILAAKSGKITIGDILICLVVSIFSWMAVALAIDESGILSKEIYSKK